MSKIYDGNDRARELGFKSFREMMFAFAAKNGKIWNGNINSDPEKALSAHINAGRWAIECECGNGSYADPNTPIMFCSICGNAALGGDARLVIFPDEIERKEIESVLMERKINMPFDIGTQTIMLPATTPELPEMHRAWIPGESVDDLRKENEDAQKSAESGGGDPDIPSPSGALENSEGGE